MEKDKKIKKQKVTKDENSDNLEIQDVAINAEADEESNGIGYEILSMKITGKS